MEYLTSFLTVAILHFLAVVSPGPDFIMITRNSLIYSRRTGIYSALGLGLGIMVHTAYSLIGIGLIISQSVLLFNAIKFLGAIYLFYLGYKSLTSKSHHTNLNQNSKEKDLTPTQAIRVGFLTNATNPKATLFFLSLFTLVISPQTPLWLKLSMGLEMVVVTFLWFAFVATIISHRIIKDQVSKIQGIAEKFVGILLIGFGIKLAFSHSK